jgi:hypothetical protein
MRSAMECLEAQGPSQGLVRLRTTHRLADRKAGLGSRSQGSRRLPALHFPHVEGKKENRETGRPGGPKNKVPEQRSVG